MKSPFKRAMIGLGIVGATCAAVPTSTFAKPAINPDAVLVNGKCGIPMVEANAALVVAGQRTLLIGDRVFVVDESKNIVRKWVNTVTSNADGSIGYQLEGNHPSGEPSTTICVKLKLTNLQIFDADDHSVSPVVMLGGKFDQWIMANAADGTRPMMFADTVFGSGNTLRFGRPIVVVGNLSNRFGAIVTRQDNSEPEKLAQLSNLQYTSAGLERIFGLRPNRQ